LESETSSKLKQEIQEIKKEKVSVEEQVETLLSQKSVLVERSNEAELFGSKLQMELAQQAEQLKYKEAELTKVKERLQRSQEALLETEKEKKQLKASLGEKSQNLDKNCDELDS